MALRPAKGGRLTVQLGAEQVTFQALVTLPDGAKVYVGHNDEGAGVLRVEHTGDMILTSSNYGRLKDVVTAIGACEAAQ